MIDIEKDVSKKFSKTCITQAFVLAVLSLLAFEKDEAACRDEIMRMLKKHEKNARLENAHKRAMTRIDRILKPKPPRRTRRKGKSA